MDKSKLKSVGVYGIIATIGLANILYFYGRIRARQEYGKHLVDAIGIKWHEAMLAIPFDGGIISVLFWVSIASLLISYLMKVEGNHQPRPKLAHNHQVAPQRKTFCSACGQPVASDAAYCENCGRKCA